MSLTSLLPISSLIAQPPPAVPVDATGLKLALVCMPWGSVARPSLAMGLLKQCARSIGCQVDLHFLNLVFASQIGAKLLRACRILETGTRTDDLESFGQNVESHTQTTYEQCDLGAGSASIQMCLAQHEQ